MTLLDERAVRDERTMNRLQRASRIEWLLPRAVIAVRAHRRAVHAGQGEAPPRQELENQMLAMTLGGYRGDRSPDRADAAIWALTSLFPAISREARAPREAPRVMFVGCRRVDSLPRSRRPHSGTGTARCEFGR